LALREPGDTPLGERLRALLLAGDPGQELCQPRAEALLFFAARVELLARRIGPALASGQDVLCERFSASTMAYQGQKPADAGFVIGLDRLCVPPELQPDRILILDLPAAESFARVRASAQQRGEDLDAIEARGVAFQERVRAGYLHYAAAHSQHCTVLPVAGLDEDAVAAQIRRALGEEVRA
jgi:dTMP kinase